MRNKNNALTETVFYILLALSEPLHGYAIMQKVEQLSDGEVRMAAGTLYGAIENLLKLGYITPVVSEDPRRKVYKLTELGEETLKADVKRIEHMAQVAKNLL